MLKAALLIRRAQGCWHQGLPAITSSSTSVKDAAGDLDTITRSGGFPPVLRDAAWVRPPQLWAVSSFHHPCSL